MEIKAECTLKKWHSDCLGDMALFKPDAFILDEAGRQVTVWEFTRGMGDRDMAFQQLEAGKQHGVCLYLQHRMLGYRSSSRQW